MPGNNPAEVSVNTGNALDDESNIQQVRPNNC